jgi:hypothetical protein
VTEDGERKKRGGDKERGGGSFFLSLQQRLKGKKRRSGYNIKSSTKIP